MVLKKRFLFLVISLFLVLTLLGSGCRQKTTLKVGILPNEEALPLYIAEQEGLFAKQGIDVELVQFQSAAERDAAIQAGTIDGVEGDLIAVALIRQGGTPVKAVSLALGATPAEGRFVLLSAPNTLTNVSEIKNKTMALSQNTIIEFVADQILKAKGINPADVQKVYVPKMPLRLEMLMQNRVDTAVLAEPLASLAELNGAAVLIDDAKLDNNISQSVFFFRDDAIKKKEEDIRKFLLVFAQCGKAVTEEPEKYRDLFNEKVHVPAELHQIFPVPTFSPLQLPTEENVRLVLSWMKEKKLLTTEFQYQDLVTDRMVP